MVLTLKANKKQSLIGEAERRNAFLTTDKP